MTDQLPPPDELHAVRARIKALQEREQALRALIFQDPAARTGNHYVADVKEVTTSRLDTKELRAMHPTLVAEFTFRVTEKRVELSAISSDGEIISLRRKQPV
jgi:predicted phage-related endonuclease